MCTYCNTILEPSNGLNLDRRGSGGLLVPNNPTVNKIKRRHLVGRCHSDTSNLQIVTQIAKLAAATPTLNSKHRHS